MVMEAMIRMVHQLTQIWISILLNFTWPNIQIWVSWCEDDEAIPPHSFFFHSQSFQKNCSSNNFFFLRVHVTTIYKSWRDKLCGKKKMPKCNAANAWKWCEKKQPALLWIIVGGKCHGAYRTNCTHSLWSCLSQSLM